MINVFQPLSAGQMCPEELMYDPIEDPIKMLERFFAYRDLETHLVKLKQWKKLVVSYAYFEIDTVTNPLYDHRMSCNLLNAAWYFLNDQQSAGSLVNLPEKAQLLFLNRESLQHAFYVKELTTAELIDPKIGIAHFFDCFSLKEGHRQLYEWLTYGLSPNVSIPNEETASFFYKHFRKLIECCWLIVQRQSVVPVEEENSSPGNTNTDELTDGEIPSSVLAGFKQFLSVVPAQRLNRGLRKMLVDYLFYNINGLPTDFEEILSDFYWLTDLLDEIQGKTIDPKFL